MQDPILFPGRTVAAAQSDQHALFALDLVVSGLVFIIGPNFLNPDALIADLNWDRQLSGNTFVEGYTADLSVDSLMALIAILESDPESRWCAIEQRLTRSRVQLDAYWEEHGILADSWAAHRARDALHELDLWSFEDAVCMKPAPAGR